MHRTPISPTGVTHAQSQTPSAAGPAAVHRRRRPGRGRRRSAAAPARRARAKLDTNGDGVIDRAEAAKAPRLAAQFDTLDKNKDGKLSRDELPRWHGKRHGRGPAAVR